MNPCVLAAPLLVVAQVAPSLPPAPGAALAAPQPRPPTPHGTPGHPAPPPRPWATPSSRPVVNAPVLSAPRYSVIRGAGYPSRMQKAEPSAPRYFVRVDVGVGSRGLGPNNALLSDAGFTAPRLWATLDGGYMLHPRIGAGLFMGIGRLQRDQEEGPRYRERSFFVGAQAPIHLWHNRYVYLRALPRLGYLEGSAELGQSTEGARFSSAAIWGLGLSIASQGRYVGATLGFMRAAAPRLGELGEAHDFGGFYAALSGVIDG